MSTNRLIVALLALVLALAFQPPAHAAKPGFSDLVANLKSPNARTRQEAAAALGKSRRREAIPPLSELVRDPEAKVRMEVVRALRELRDPSAIPALVTSLTDGDTKIREESIGTLVEIYSERERTGAVSSFLNVFSDEYDRASVPPYTAVEASVYTGLAAGLRDEDKGIREEAALSLGILDGRSALGDLQAALQDPEASVRGAAATAIGKIGTAEDGKALIPLLADANGEVRQRVLQAIGVLRVREAGPALREMYEQNRKKDQGVRVLACLSRIGDPAQADLFRELVQDPNLETRRLAIEGLGRVADTSTLPAFKKDYQRERSDELKLAYSFALTLLGDHAFLDSIVLSLPSRTLGNRCRSYILEMGRSISGELYPYLNDPEANIRASLADLLAQIGDPAAIPHLQPLINDPSTQVADRANRAVERLKRAGPPR
ncbi:MAG TPA: HEAT repeat domain-containing protein [Vicinamibacteria bacterium]|nr:HEAT repeat domain-containing protein [Vicinamibacteria bacterium]